MLRSGYNFVYDAAGRLSKAWVPGHTLEYRYDDNLTCGPWPSGDNSNRTTLVDSGVTTKYCYDGADRLVSSTDAAIGTPTYDSRGEHPRARGPEAVLRRGRSSPGHRWGRGKRSLRPRCHRSHRRPPCGRCHDSLRLRRTGGLLVLRHGHQHNTSPPLERTVGILGGVLLTKRAGGDVWSYPHVHGDVIAVANATGVKQGGTRTYDPAPTPGPGNRLGSWWTQALPGGYQSSVWNFVEVNAQSLPKVRAPGRCLRRPTRS